jgi:hypothetical protein
MGLYLQLSQGDRRPHLTNWAYGAEWIKHRWIFMTSMLEDG